MFIKWNNRRDEVLTQAFCTDYREMSEFHIPIEFHNDRMILRKQLTSLSSDGDSSTNRSLLQAIQLYSSTDCLLDNDEFMLNSVSFDGKALAYGSKRIRENYMICKAALENNLTDYDVALNKDALKLFHRGRLEFQDFNGKNEDESVEIIKQAIDMRKEIQFNWLPDSVLYSKKCALLLVSNFDCLHYFPKQFKDDIEIVRASMIKLPSLIHVSERIRNNKQMVMELLDLIQPCHPDGINFLKYVSEEFKNDRELVSKAINRCALEVCHASKEFQSNHDMNIEALEAASKYYKQDSWPCFVFYNRLATIQSLVLNNKKLLMKALESSCIIYEFACTDLRNDPDMIEMASRHANKSFIEFIPSQNPIRKDRDFIKKMLKQNGTSIQYFNYSVRSDPELCIIAVKQNGLALRYVNSPTLEMRIEAVKQNGYAQNNHYFQELYQIRMEHEYGGQLYLPKHLIACAEFPVQYLSVMREKSTRGYIPMKEWENTFLNKN
ncbi:predicted protein [Naegleria gruberi]|uniref:Predicted protein n=1 Tax=Naegleria gruberi TaxID=5762 RepID=D2VFA7_NAEGR|nr:uncharacterized protein NAEGRDRAFT_67558 [Naegleria gruberi]EFC44426.1 predicted protein [Naegleria gruberi]|eukprot:XP_002677170.1 predicted protein [Naegleria gruberi strain NEG-M]